MVWSPRRGAVRTRARLFDYVYFVAPPNPRGARNFPAAAVAIVVVAAATVLLIY